MPNPKRSLQPSPSQWTRTAGDKGGRQLGAETIRHTQNTGHSTNRLVSSKRHRHQTKNAGDKPRCKETKEMTANNTWTWTGCWASLVAQLVKNPPAMRETWVQSLSWDDPLEKGKATHSSIPVWRIPWTVYPWVAKSRTQLSDFHFTSLIWMSEQKIAIMDTRGEMGNLDYEILIILR